MARFNHWVSTRIGREIIKIRYNRIFMMRKFLEGGSLQSAQMCDSTIVLNRVNLRSKYYFLSLSSSKVMPIKPTKIKNHKSFFDFFFHHQKW